MPRDEPEQARRERPADAAEREAQERKREVERADRHEAHHGRRLVGVVPRVDVEEHEDQGGTEGADVEGQEGDGGEQRHRRPADQEHEGEVRVGGGAAAEDALFEGPPVLHEPDRLDEPGEGERPEEEEGGDEAPELGGLRERGVERSEAGGGGVRQEGAREGGVDRSGIECISISSCFPLSSCSSAPSTTTKPQAKTHLQLPHDLGPQQQQQVGVNHAEFCRRGRSHGARRQEAREFRDRPVGIEEGGRRVGRGDPRGHDW